MARLVPAVLALLALGCIDTVRSGLPPLVQGCRQDADCPATYLCADGGCEAWQCTSSCDCPGPAAGFGCVEGDAGVAFCVPGLPPTFPCALPDGGAALCASGGCDAG